jgi:hypothetical protein
MSDENINASSTKMPSADLSGMDTKTRKTVRLGVAQQGLTPNTETVISDPLSGRDTDTSNLEILDDTQTRRTVKIKPIAATTRNTVKLNVDEGATGAAPASAEDTQTRKTLVLKPLSSVTTPQITPAAPATASDAGATGTMRLKKPIPRPMATQTLQPSAPGSEVTQTLPPAPAPGTEKTITLTAPSAAKKTVEAVNDGDDTSTRKADVKKPEPQTITLTPPTAAPAEAVNDGDDTTTRKAVAVTPVAATAGNDDQTMKLARPQRPAIPPRPTVPGAAPAGAAPKIPALKPVPGKPAVPTAPAAKTVAVPGTQTLQPAPAAGSEKTVTLAPGAAPTAGGEKTVTLAPGATPAPAPAPEKKADDDLVLAPSMKEKKAAEEKKAEEADPKAYLAAKKAAEKAMKAAKAGENKPSAFYLVVALLTILAVAVCVLYTTVHYLDFEQKVKIYDKVSFVPLMDKK